jgi:hypothetical protein
MESAKRNTFGNQLLLAVLQSQDVSIEPVSSGVTSKELVISSSSLSIEYVKYPINTLEALANIKKA